jgi:NADPH:quinone reductase-like Zn-dependent oxidoreductase
MPDNKVLAGYHIGMALLNYPEKLRTAMEAIIKLHEEGKVKPEIHQVFSLEEVRHV